MVETSKSEKDLKHPLPPSLQPQKRRTGTSWVHVEASHWVPEISFLKTVHHRFWTRLIRLPKRVGIY
jgi:hypothetical protein